jgi:hypothetical protein
MHILQDSYPDLKQLSEIKDQVFNLVGSIKWDLRFIKALLY